MKNNKEFNKLMVGQVFANTGDILYTIVVISSVFTLTNSALAASLSPVIMTIGSIFSGMLVPILVRHFSITGILFKSQLCKTIILIGLAFYIENNTNQINVIYLYFFIAAISFFDGCAEPISRSLIPKLVSPAYLIKANSLYGSISQIVSVGSWAVGSSLLVLLSISKLIWIDVILFILSSYAFWMLPKINVNEKKIKKNISEEFFSGWKEIFNNKTIRTISIIEVLEQASNTAWISAVVLVFVKEILHVNENWWGYINTTYFIGSIIGSMLIYKYSEQVEKRKSSFIFYSALVGAVTTFLVSVESSPILILVYSVLIGVFYQSRNIPQTSILQKITPKENLTAVYSSINILNISVFSVVSLIMGMITDLYGSQMVFVISSMCLFTISIIIRKNKARLDI